MPRCTMRTDPIAGNQSGLALVLTLLPGAYSAQVSGGGGSTGVVLLEIYELP